jgi:predicted enzyme related to lactoylglutathione lyase
MFAFTEPATAAVVPTTRIVARLDEAIRRITRAGGSVTSERRTAPGIASWVLVTDERGNEQVLWEDATARPERP